ncbi:MAG: N-acetyltransferase [Deltaproteobacteria bacterium]|nr:MAG: N-acetyltransferase [Deltaproteobacteria bacterium]
MALSDVVAAFFTEVFGELLRGLVEAIFLAPLRALGLVSTPPRFEEAPVEAIRPLRHRVLREGRPLEDAVWDGDDEARHFLLRWAGEVVAVATVMRRPYPDGEGPGLQLRGMAVAPEHQGKGLGAELLTGIRKAVGEPLWCNARDTALPFYEKQGWDVQGDGFVIERVGPHHRMISG